MSSGGDEKAARRRSRWDQTTEGEAPKDAAPIDAALMAALKAKAKLEAKVAAAAAAAEKATGLIPAARSTAAPLVPTLSAVAAPTLSATRPEDRPQGGMYSAAPGRIGRIFYPPAVAPSSREERRQGEHGEAPPRERPPRERDAADEEAEPRPRKPRRTFTEEDDDG